ncbi:flagellar basal body L-ring protein FlgH [uncultured Psychromonas sp.]|uniref:flagellar basal body L-ring protein FlgH n=1 Tax=uncultured Psychromonas sp. TaxID=173974 RepID=UPI00260E39C0|nr:flagellar basal body L-ring protein FlgH [uncultured Psychromonas sp.]
MMKPAFIIGITLLTGCSTLEKVDLTPEISQINQVTQNTSGTQITQRNTSDPAIPDDPYYAPIDPSRSPAAVEITGSLFNANQSSDLYSYAPKFKIGDTINVLLQEEVVANKSASTNLSNENSYNLDPIKIPGGNLSVNGNDVELGISQDQGFDGESGSSQSHNIQGRITVSVINVLNNGNLVVRGEKWLVINNGKEYIRLTGIIRPLDVSLDNSIESYQVADSRIEFSATGEHAEVQTRGWLSSLFSGSFWPI